MSHTVAETAAKAVKNSERKTATEQTPEQLIDALRGNLRANMYAPVHQIAALLARFDFEREVSTALIATATKTIEDSTAEKQVMTDTIFGLTQKVQELQAKLDQYAITSTEAVVITPLYPNDRQAPRLS